MGNDFSNIEGFQRAHNTLKTPESSVYNVCFFIMFMFYYVFIMYYVCLLALRRADCDRCRKLGALKKADLECDDLVSN